MEFGSCVGEYWQFVSCVREYWLFVSCVGEYWLFVSLWGNTSCLLVVEGGILAVCSESQT